MFPRAIPRPSGKLIAKPKQVFRYAKFRSRLTLYFPVSALVTLFGNILQNPLDPRARSDTKLMSLVVTFLSTLGEEAETGGVHRMLGVCSEFERIARIVIDKTENDTSRRKRKTHEPPKPINPGTNSHHPQTSPRPNSSTTTPTPHYNQNSRGPGQSSPSMRGSGNPNGNGYSPMNTASSNNGQAPRDGQGSWPQDYPSTGSMPGDTPDFSNWTELTGFGQPLRSPPMPGATPSGFQPLLPQDLWQLPMSIDWDWAEFSGGAYPGFENGAINPNGH